MNHSDPIPNEGIDDRKLHLIKYMVSKTSYKLQAIPEMIVQSRSFIRICVPVKRIVKKCFGVAIMAIIFNDYNFSRGGAHQYHSEHQLQIHL